MKSVQLLDLYIRFQNGGRLSKKEMTDIFEGKSTRTIQRYISTLNSYLSELGSRQLIEYDRENNQYYLELEEDRYFSAKQVLLITKILLSTRSLSKLELTSVIEHLTARLNAGEKEVIHQSIESESFHYTSELDQDDMLDIIWEINECVLKGKVIEIEYANALNKVNQHIIKPLYITFSEFYYYLVGMKEDGRILIFRVDRIMAFKERRHKFKKEIPYHQNAGELKKRIYFMYGGDFKRVQFEFNGGIIESVIDRFPTAELLKKDYVNNRFLVEIEVIGDGIVMWLLSQGSRVKVISPASIVDVYKEEVLKMYKGLGDD